MDGAVVDAPSLREIVSTRVLVGRRVRLQGRCLTVARLRGPPDAHGDWQLEADGVTVFVAGPLPKTCSAPGGSDTVTIIARVAEDTLPSIGDLPPAPRRYLVRIVEEKE
jgi:hypothetical protein